MTGGGYTGCVPVRVRAQSALWTRERPSDGSALRVLGIARPCFQDAGLLVNYAQRLGLAFEALAAVRAKRDRQDRQHNCQDHRNQQLQHLYYRPLFMAFRADAAC